MGCCGFDHIYDLKTSNRYCFLLHLKNEVKNVNDNLFRILNLGVSYCLPSI